MTIKEWYKEHEETILTVAGGVGFAIGAAALTYLGVDYLLKHKTATISKNVTNATVDINKPEFKDCLKEISNEVVNEVEVPKYDTVIHHISMGLSKLPEGHHASEKAKQAALEHGFVVVDGTTFKNEFDRPYRKKKSA